MLFKTANYVVRDPIRSRSGRITLLVIACALVLTILSPVESITSEDDPRLLSYTIPAETIDLWTPRSACNYKLRLDVPEHDLIAYSDYFAVIKANDTGINETKLCPSQDNSLVPFAKLCPFCFHLSTPTE